MEKGRIPPSPASLQAMRKQKGLTLQQIATAAGVSPGEAYALEIGGYVNTYAKEQIISLLTEREESNLEKTMILPVIKMP